MLRDVNDRILWALLLVTLAGLGAVAVTSGGRQSGGPGQSADRALERQLAYRARSELIRNIYQPVEQLRREGQLQAALLKLDELGKTYPGEAHGSILQGEILMEMGVVDQAVASYVRGIKSNGEYVDDRSPLSRRTEIEAVVRKGLATVRERGTGSRPGGTLPKDIFYLQSRLAGGCE